MVEKKFSKAKSFNKTNISKIPENKPIVYLFKAENNKKLYVGMAKRNRAQERLLEHLMKKGEKIPGTKKFQILQFDNMEKAKKTEKRLIKKLSPRYNEAGN